MREYLKPIITQENIIVNEVIMLSGVKADGNYADYEENADDIWGFIRH